MPRVDFYVLEGVETRPRLVYACRIAEKAFDLQQRVSVLTETAADAAALDDLLWTFRDRSFIPHELQSTERAPDCPVVIGWQGQRPSHPDLLINLGASVPENFAGYTRIAEVIDADSERRRAGRERYRYYVEHGIKPDTHNIGGSTGGEQEAP